MFTKTVSRSWICLASLFFYLCGLNTRIMNDILQWTILGYGQLKLCVCVIPILCVFDFFPYCLYFSIGVYIYIYVCTIFNFELSAILSLIFKSIIINLCWSCRYVLSSLPSLCFFFYSDFIDILLLIICRKLLIRLSVNNLYLLS